MNLNDACSVASTTGLFNIEIIHQKRMQRMRNALKNTICPLLLLLFWSFFSPVQLFWYNQLFCILFAVNWKHKSINIVTRQTQQKSWTMEKRSKRKWSMDKSIGTSLSRGILDCFFELLPLNSPSNTF